MRGAAAVLCCAASAVASPCPGAASGGAPPARHPRVSARAPEPPWPLSALVGTWEGVGQNVVQVPDWTGMGAPEFQLFLQNYTETITFAPLLKGPMNRGYSGNRTAPTGQNNLVLGGVSYSTVITLVNPNGTLGEALHEETGYWLAEATGGGGELVRILSVPRGAAAAARGMAELLPVPAAGNVSFIPYGTAMPPNMNMAPPGYMDRCMYPHLTCNAPGLVLKDALAGQTLTNLTRLQVSAVPGSGEVAATPFIDKQTPVSGLNATLWLETVAGDGGAAATMQIQYMQEMFLDFRPRFDCEGANPEPDCATQPTILWPHVQVATLRRTA